MPGGRRSKTVWIDGQEVAKQSRPFAVAGDVFRSVADESLRANARYLEIVTRDMARVLSVRGGRWKIRGTRGNRVPLEGKQDVKAFSKRDGGMTVVGAVRGLPQGFWEIVEHGSGRHLIYSRQGKGGAVRTSRSGRQQQNYMTRTQVKRALNKEQSLNRLRPLAPASRAWAAQYVVHPGHGSLGTPWAQSMMDSEGIVSRELSAVQTAAMITAWKG